MDNFGVFLFFWSIMEETIGFEGVCMNYIYLIKEHYPLLTKSEKKWLILFLTLVRRSFIVR